MSTALARPVDPTKHWDQWTDGFGTTVYPGDWVIHGSSHSLSIGTIESINRLDAYGNELSIQGDQSLWMIYKQTHDWNDYQLWHDSVQNGVTTPWATITMIPREYDLSAAKKGNRKTIKKLNMFMKLDPPR